MDLLGVVICLLMTSSAGATTTEPTEEDTQPVIFTRLAVLEGGEVRLPCDTEPAHSKDAAIMVMWFKDGGGTPIYSYDARETPSLHRKQNSSLGSRARFQVISHPSALLLEDILPEDQGLYRCRVDFRNSPTRNAKMYLAVVVPVKRLLITDSSGVEVSSRVGPYYEGYDLILTCQAFGGLPAPWVKWWVGDRPLDSTSSLRPDGVTVNLLLLQNISREHRRSKLRCEASNSNLSSPLSKEVRLEVYLKPSQVEIIREPQSYISAGLVHEWKCLALGSYPEVQLTWWKDGVKLQQQYHKVSSDEQPVSYSLTFEPKSDDDGKALTCQAENPLVPLGKMEARIILRVAYSPKAYLKLGNVLDPRDIKEGDDVYFECDVRANPAIQHLTWLHEGHELRHNVSAGIILSNQTLVVRSVSRENGGLYTCVATNTAGQGTSNYLALHVQYAPRCKEPREHLMGALKHETVHLLCEVEAQPPITDFFWTYNRSREVISVPRKRFSTEYGSSRLDFTPVDDMDYGTLACWAQNPVGKQVKPCVFQIIPAGPPHSVEACVTMVPSTGELEVRCQPGFDGGLPQNFILELRPEDDSNIQSVYRVLAAEPRFTLVELEPQREYQAAVFAVNAKGRSRPVQLRRLRLPGLEKFTGSERTYSLWSLLVPLVASAGVILLVVLLVAGILCARSRVVRSESRNRRKGSSVAIPSNVGANSDALDLLEGNPLLAPTVVRNGAPCNNSTQKIGQERKYPQESDL